MTKFPLLRIIENQVIHSTLEGVRESSATTRSVLLTGNNQAACQQYLMAMIYYGNITELPFSAQGVYENENIFIYAHDALYEYFSSNKMLISKARELRRSTYSQLEPYIFNSDYIGFDSKLASLKTTKKTQVDADDLINAELGAVDK